LGLDPSVKPKDDKFVVENLSEILNTPIVKHSVMIAGHATSVSIEKPFWDAFKNIAKAQGKSKINQSTHHRNR